MPKLAVQPKNCNTKITLDHDYGVQTMYTLHFINWCEQLLELHLPVVLTLLNVKFVHTQISVSKIGIPMLKITYIYPWHYKCNMNSKYYKLSAQKSKSFPA